jgi:hypothetical protein
LSWLEELSEREQLVQAEDLAAIDASLPDAIGVTPQPAEGGFRNVPEFYIKRSGSFAKWNLKVLKDDFPSFFDCPVNVEADLWLDFL